MKVGELFRTLGPVPVHPSDSGIGRAERLNGSVKPNGSEFQKLLEGSVTISQHAQSRIQSRSIPWTPDMERRISTGINVAQQKGSREALILADDVAVIANVKSRTIVTAMERSQMKEQVITNIDSAVLV